MLTLHPHEARQAQDGAGGIGGGESPCHKVGLGGNPVGCRTCLNMEGPLLGVRHHPLSRANGPGSSKFMTSNWHHSLRHEWHWQSDLEMWEASEVKEHTNKQKEPVNCLICLQLQTEKTVSFVTRGHHRILKQQQCLDSLTLRSPPFLLSPSFQLLFQYSSRRAHVRRQLLLGKNRLCCAQ